MKEYYTSHKKQILTVLAAFLLGAFWIIALRFVTLKTNAVHYHANFAVFLNGERLPLDNPLFYEEVQQCGGEEFANPKIRVHMHNMESHIIHVHDDGATWGHFFANIGMTNGDSLFRIDDDVYVDGKKSSIRFMLNGEEVDTTANRTIKSEDRLLVSIGASADEDLQAQYEQIQSDAGEFNGKYDPSSCSGGKELSFTERLKKAVGFLGE